MKQMILIYAGVGGLTLFALLIGGAGMAEKAALLLLFGVVAFERRLATNRHATSRTQEKRGDTTGRAAGTGHT